MLLQRLAEYADRVADQLPAEYYRPKVIDRVLRLSEDGRSADLEDRRVPAKQRDKALVEQVPYVQRSGTKVPPNLLVDTAEFVLGVPKDSGAGEPTEKARAEAERRHTAYRELALLWAERAADDPAAAALRVYLTDSRVRRPPLEGVAAKETVAIRVGTRWLHALPSVQSTWGAIVRERKGGGDEQAGLCLVCGTHGALLSTIPEPVKKGAVPTAGGSNEGQLVSINTAAQGRNGLQQLANTPICHRCGSRAMASLNHLLSSRTQCRRFREHSAFVWWTRQPGEDPDLVTTLNDQPDDATIKRLIDSIDDRPSPRAVTAVEPDLFYGITLGLNNARIVVRDWIDVPVAEMKRKLGRWYERHCLYDGWNDATRYVPMWQMAQSCGRWTGDRYAKDSAPRGLDAELLHAALHDRPIPARVLPLLIQRVHADHRVDVPRVALLRLILNPPEKTGSSVMPKLDENCVDPGYVSGRMFAVLEAIQRKAIPNLNTTLRDKHFRTAASAPNGTMAQLVTNATAHLRRIRQHDPKAATALENRLAALYSSITDDLPLHLPPAGQGRFITGYFHQRQADLAAAAAHRKDGGDTDAPDGTATPDALTA